MKKSKFVITRLSGRKFESYSHFWTILCFQIEKIRNVQLQHGSLEQIGSLSFDLK